LVEFDIQQAIDGLLHGVEPGAGRPFYALAAGGPSTGKYLMPFLLAQHQVDFLHINDDLLIPYLGIAACGEPHPEKRPEHIAAYYTLVDALVLEAMRRGISIVLEDHGDFPDVYRGHLACAEQYGYANHLVITSISQKTLEEKAIYKDCMPHHREWARAYQKRVFANIDTLTEMFDSGSLVETRSDYLSDDSQYHASNIMRFMHCDWGLHKDVLADDRYSELMQWNNCYIDPAYIEYFDAVDRAMHGYTPMPVRGRQEALILPTGGQLATLVT